MSLLDEYDELVRQTNDKQKSNDAPVRRTSTTRQPSAEQVQRVQRQSSKISDQRGSSESIKRQQTSSLQRQQTGKKSPDQPESALKRKQTSLMDEYDQLVKQQTQNATQAN